MLTRQFNCDRAVSTFNSAINNKNLRKSLSLHCGQCWVTLTSPSRFGGEERVVDFYRFLVVTVGLSVTVKRQLTV